MRDGIGRPLRPVSDQPPKPGKRIDPAQYANRSGTEHAAQVALFMWASEPEQVAKYPELAWMFAIPNGGLRDKITAANLKAEGVKDGVSDVFLPVVRGSWSGLFIEMKRPNGAQGRAGKSTPKQREFVDEMRSRGYGAMVATGFEEARDAIIGYLEWKQ